MVRKYKATYSSGKQSTVLATDIEQARKKLFLKEGKVAYKTLERVNALKPRRRK